MDVRGTTTMETPSLYPLRFRPILRQLIWGGRRLGTVLHKPIGAASDYAESWELSDYRDQVSVVEEGPLAGTSLHELIRSRPLELLGPAVGPRDQFPLLVKFIDANQDLSVQVHPDDEKGRRLANDNGKTETWVVLDAEPGSVIYAGLKAGVGPDEFRRAIASGEVEPLLHRFEARPGDAILIEAGTVHAIGAGVLLAEIQQMSDATFRVFDWNRVGPDGRPRELHVEQAMESIDFERGPVNPMVPRAEPLDGAGSVERLARSPYFAVERLRLGGAATVGRPDRFTILMGVEGRSEVVHDGRPFALDFGQTLLLPASIGECRIVPEGNAVVLSCVVP
jgi:mannose-6-phosphate isomerase